MYLNILMYLFVDYIVRFWYLPYLAACHFESQTWTYDERVRKSRHTAIKQNNTKSYVNLSRNKTFGLIAAPGPTPICLVISSLWGGVAHAPAFCRFRPFEGRCVRATEVRAYDDRATGSFAGTSPRFRRCMPCRRMPLLVHFWARRRRWFWHCRRQGWPDPGAKAAQDSSKGGCSGNRV